jgi:hypothetical protein
VVIAALLAVVLFFSGCSTELLETVEKMVEFSNRLDKVAPEIAFTTPNYGAQGVPQNISVTVTFDEAMDPDTVNDVNFTVETSGTAQPGTVAYVESHNMAVWTPTFDFYSSTVYTGRLNTNIRDASGNRLQSEYTWTFQTGTGSDTTRPSIDFRFPDISAMGMGINIDISAGFDGPLDPTSVNKSTFSVWQGSGELAGSVLYDDASSTVIFVPDANLQPNTTYTVKVSPEIRDLAGNAYGGTGAQWNFTTGATSDEDPPQIDSGNPPEPDQGDVNLMIDVPNNSITITFDEAMNPETINNSTFTLETASGPVEGTVGYQPSLYKAVFLPSGDLDYMTLHTATISGAVEDVAGNQLGSSYSWSFYTVANDSSTSSVTANIVKVTDAAGKVSAYVLFTDQSGNAVTGLTKYHFRLREKVDPDIYGEVPTSGIGMGSSRESKSVVLLVDNTASMSSIFAEYLSILAEWVQSLGQFDSAELMTVSTPSPAQPPFVYPPNGFPPGYLTSDKNELLDHISSDLQIFGYPYTVVHEAIWYGMEDLMNQPADEMRGLNAVISFTDAQTLEPYGPHLPPDVLSNATSYGIPIYSIAFRYAQAIPELADLAYNEPASNFYEPADYPDDIYALLMAATADMDSQLNYVYKLSWFTGYGSGDLDIEITVNYSTQTGGDFSNSDTENNYTLP